MREALLQGCFKERAVEDGMNVLESLKETESTLVFGNREAEASEVVYDSRKAGKGAVY